MALISRGKTGAEPLLGPSGAGGRHDNPRAGRRLAVALVIGILLGAPAAAAGRDHASSTGLLFSGTNKSAWVDQSATDTRITTVPNPSNGSGTALRFQAYNQDVFPLTPTSNPRAQLVTPLRLKAGDQFWESFEVYVPRSFPLAASPRGWIALGSPAYGPPFSVGPSIGLKIAQGDFRFQRNGDGSHPWQIAWQEPLVLARWVRFTWHVLLSQNGYVQLFVDNQPAALAGAGAPSTTLYLPVTQGEGPWYSQLSVYFKHDAFPRITLYFRDFRIATTEALAVAG